MGLADIFKDDSTDYVVGMVVVVVCRGVAGELSANRLDRTCLFHFRGRCDRERWFSYVQGPARNKIPCHPTRGCVSCCKK